MKKYLQINLRKAVVIFGIAALTLPAVIFAGSVGDTLTTFSNGEVADANEVNSNFTDLVIEINDNDGRIDSNASAITSHQHDTLTGDLEVEGRVLADRLEYRTPRTQYLSIHESFFRPVISGNLHTSTLNDGAYMTGTFGRTLVAPVILPHGARITGFKAYFNDLSSPQNLNVSLRRDILADDIVGIIALVDSNGSAGHHSVEQTGLDETVDNQNRAYFVRVYNPVWSEVNMDLRIRGAMITYELDEAQ